jgi:hypothetical protein
MPKCLTCHIELDDIDYRFCSISCQKAYIQVIEKKITMRHSFTPNSETKLCIHCEHNLIDHTRLATCSICNNKNNCDLTNGKLVCTNCEQKELDDVKDTISQADKIINEARAINNSIRYSGDLFNARTIAIIELKKGIWSDETLSDNEKQKKYQESLAERFHHLQKVIFEADETKHTATVEQLAITRTLRDLGSELREEIRNKIKELDNSYQPIQVVKPKLKEVKKKTPFDRMVENVMVSKKCSKEEAIKLLEAGGLK